MQTENSRPEINSLYYVKIDLDQYEMLVTIQI